jgi:hypothetical protein
VDQRVPHLLHAQTYFGLQLHAAVILLVKDLVKRNQSELRSRIHSELDPHLVTHQESELHQLQVLVQAWELVHQVQQLDQQQVELHHLQVIGQQRLR